MAILKRVFLFTSPVLAASSDDPPELSGLEMIFGRILNIAITLAGLAVFIMLIVGGFKYLISGGDPKQTKSATATITMAVVGLIAAIAAWFILRFIAHFTGLGDELLIFKLVE